MRKMGDSSELPWMLIGILAVVVLGAAAAFSPVLCAALIGPFLAFAIFTKRPRLGFTAWLVSVAAIPCWIGVNAAFFVPASLIGAGVALTCLFVGTTWRPNWADLAVVVLLVAAWFGVEFGSSAGQSNATAFASMFTLWLPGYLVGRFVCEKASISFVKAAVGITMGTAALLAIIEKLLSWHPFAGQVAVNSLAAIWAPIQVRGGVERSEWAFGHSIALGGSLSLAIPFLLSSSLKTKTKTILLALILAGVATTLSRGAMLAAGVTLLLSLMTSRNLRGGHKALLFVASGILAGFVIADFSTVSDEAGSEVTDSSGYRISLFTRLISTLEPFGRSSSYMSGANGQVQYGNFTSIDNSFMAIGLGFGWIAMAVVAIPFVVMAWRFIQRSASFAEIALLGQLPVITTVAMITQYQVIVWMVAGLAATLAIQRPEPDAIPAATTHTSLEAGAHV